MTEYRSHSSAGISELSDQSSGRAQESPPQASIILRLLLMFDCKFGRTSGKSVKVTLTPQAQAAVIPTSPVPAPSSSTRTPDRGRYFCSDFNLLESKTEEAHVLKPMLSFISDGSYNWNLTIRFSDSGILKVLVMLGIAALPDRSLSLALAAAQICSLQSSSSIQMSGDETIDVKYRGMPTALICPIACSWICLTPDSENGVCSKALSVSRRVLADGFAYGWGRSWTERLWQAGQWGISIF
jgi:hypothetical protein